MRLLVRLIGDRRYQKKVGLDEMIEAALSSAVSIDKSLLVELHCQLMKLKLKTDKRTQDPVLTVSLHLIGDLISDESAYQRGRALTKKVTTCLFSFEGVQELCYSLWIDKVAIFYILPWVWKKDTGKAKQGSWFELYLERSHEESNSKGERGHGTLRWQNWMSIRSRLRWSGRSAMLPPYRWRLKAGART